jgi:type VI secretion system protein ImpF
MAQLDLPPGLLPSMKDRLLDPESMGIGGQPGYSLQDVLESVREDLEELFNTRLPYQVPENQYPELARSVATYGLADITNLGVTGATKQEAIGHVIEKAIVLHEPRLRNVRASQVKSRALALRATFHVDAELRVDPAPPVAFETVVELTTGHASISERTV